MESERSGLERAAGGEQVARQEEDSIHAGGSILHGGQVVQEQLHVLRWIASTSGPAFDAEVAWVVDTRCGRRPRIDGPQGVWSAKRCGSTNVSANRRIAG